MTSHIHSLLIGVTWCQGTGNSHGTMQDVTESREEGGKRCFRQWHTVFECFFHVRLVMQKVTKRVEN